MRISDWSSDVCSSDLVSAFPTSGDTSEAQAMLLRMVDFLKGRGVTAVFTHLAYAKSDETQTDAGLTSLMDAWILLLNRESKRSFTRQLDLLTALGIELSTQIRTHILGSPGITL